MHVPLSIHWGVYTFEKTNINKVMRLDYQDYMSKEKDNITDEQKELIELRKRNKQLEMENDILKQAALILGRK